MCATRSIYSWDIVVQKDGEKLFLDKRDGTQFGMKPCGDVDVSPHDLLTLILHMTDFVSVNENAAEAPLESGDKENPNTPQQLALESTYINKNFSQQVLRQVCVINHNFWCQQRQRFASRKSLFNSNETLDTANRMKSLLCQTKIPL